MADKVIKNLLPTDYRIKKCRGQVAVLFALFIPLLFLILGLVLDLGWYYLNVSRLQNAADAADAAAVAGAQTIMDSEYFSGYKSVTLIGKYPAKVSNEYRVSNIYELTAIENGNSVAKDYIAKNLSSDKSTIINSWTKSEVGTEEGLYEKDDNLYYVVKLKEEIQHFMLPGWFDDMTAPVTAVALISKQAAGNYADVDDVVLPDAPDISSVDETPDDTDTSDTTEPESEQPVVTNTLTLNFDANGGYFNGNETDTQSSQTLKALEDMEDDDKLSISSGKGTPTYSNNTKEFKGWSTEKNPSANSPIVYYYDGKQLTKSEIAALFGSSTTVTLYAVWVDKTTTSNTDTNTDTTPEITEETITPHNNRTLWEQMQYLIAKNVYDQSWDVSVAKYGSGAIYHNSFKYCSNTYLNSYHYYTEQINMNEYDEQQYWDSPTYRKIGEQTHYFLDFLRSTTIRDGKTAIGVPKYGIYYNSNYRTHSLLNVNTCYETRAGHNDDPLYCNFEGEPYVGDDTVIRQIVININVDTTADKYRPLFFYYEGPDARPGKKDRVSILKPENAQPVILNLNANFKGVLFMPEVPVVINGNGHTFEGFIVAKEFRYLSTSGEQVKYSIKGETDKKYSDNKIHINTSNGNVNSVKVTDSNALELYSNNANANKFNLSSASKFRTFKAESGVKFMYVFYDNNLTMDETPFHEYCDLSKELIPLYDGNGVRVTKWEDVKLYDRDNRSTRNEIPKKIEGTTNIRTVRLDSDGNPSPIYDEAGNPVYFCEDYIKLTGTYEIFTLDRVADKSRNEKEFLLTKTNILNVSNTDDWK